MNWRMPNLRGLISGVKGLKLRELAAAAGRVVSFVLLLVVYLVTAVVERVGKWKYFPTSIRNATELKLGSVHTWLIKKLDRKQTDTISRIYLIDLAFHNMKAKKSRTLITVGGMAIGIGAIVFLVSVGYGMQQLVVSRVARLDEMRQADISPQPGGKVKIDDKVVADLKEIANVDKVLPLISVVGRVNYQNSVSDMAVFGVTTEYLTQSAIKPIEGRVFESDEISVPVSVLPDEGDVAGVADEMKPAKWGEKLGEVEYSIYPEEWVRVRSKPSPDAEIMGYTRRAEGEAYGEELWGGEYTGGEEDLAGGVDEDGRKLGRWLKAKVRLWKKAACDADEEELCEPGGYMKLVDEWGAGLEEDGYMAQVNMKVNRYYITPAKVLAATDEWVVGEVQATDTGILAQAEEWVEIASEAGILQPPPVRTVKLTDKALKQAVVNRAMLKLLNLKETEAVGKVFSTVFVVVGSLVENGEKVESEMEEYTIVGVTPDDKTPVFYVPFVDLRSLGIVNYTQIKLVSKFRDDLARIRKQAEAMGFATGSVADTVTQINSLFATVRAVLGLLGMVALAVASLGMFNTLTVSLLERTREVGLMKAMGMKSSEVQELFLTESMVMGFFGGVTGIVLGYSAGKLLGVGLSLLAVFKGVGWLDVAYLPIMFSIVVLTLSLFVGIITGIYPAKRATKISALNALRYE